MHRSPWHRIWKHLEKYKSPSDGHCLLHSVLTSLKSQHIDLNLNKLVQVIKTEVDTNLHSYLPIFQNVLPDELYRDMGDYLKFKHYDSLFGDLVSLILANGLDIDILILMSPLDTHYRRHVLCENLNVPNDTVYVYKGTDCYNSVMHMKYKSHTAHRVFLVWNSNGQTEHKFSNDIAGELMMKHDIILLSEIWTESPTRILC